MGGNPNSARSGSPLMHIVCSQFNLDRQDPAFYSSYHQRRTDRNAQPQPASYLTDAVLAAIAEDDVVEQQPHDAVLRILLRYGADVNIIHRDTGMKPLHTAAFWGDQSAIEILVREARVDPNCTMNTTNRWLPMHYACSEGQIFSIQALITCGASVWSNRPPARTSTLLQTSIPDASEDAAADAMIIEQVEVVSEQQQQVTQPPAPLDLLAFDSLRSKILAYARRCERTRTAVVPAAP
jgi:ankyrin repeat protein